MRIRLRPWGGDVRRRGPRRPVSRRGCRPVNLALFAAGAAMRGGRTPRHRRPKPGRIRACRATATGHRPPPAPPPPPTAVMGRDRISSKVATVAPLIGTPSRTTATSIRTRHTTEVVRVGSSRIGRGELRGAARCPRRSGYGRDRSTSSVRRGTDRQTPPRHCFPASVRHPSNGDAASFRWPSPRCEAESRRGR